MQMLFRTPLAAFFLIFGTTTFLPAQEADAELEAIAEQAASAENVAGQEAIADVKEFSEAIDLLYAYPVEEQELKDFYLTMTSLTAWARA
jgi:hypothetical protein